MDPEALKNLTPAELQQLYVALRLRDLEANGNQPKPQGGSSVLGSVSRLIQSLGGGSAGGAAAGGASGAGAGAGAASGAGAGTGAATGAGAGGEFAFSLDPTTLGMIGAIAAGVNYNRMSKKTKTMGTGEALRKAAKDPRNYLIPSGFLGAAFGDKDMYLKEHRRLLGLQKKGINVPQNLIDATRLEKGRSKEELIAEEQAKIDRGEYGNVAFAQSRNEADLKPQDIMGYAAFMDRFGDDWWNKFSDSQRKAIGQKALDAGAVRERHGTINVDWNKVGLPEDVSTLTYKDTPTQQAQSVVPKVGKGQVGRLSPGVYVNDRGQTTKALTSNDAKRQNYGNKIPRTR